MLLICTWIVITLPIIRFACKRIVLLFKLKNVCKKNNLILIPTHTFWLFGCNKNKNTDAYIITPDTIYSIKLFSVNNRKSHLVFIDDIHYFIRSFRFTIFHYYYSHDHKENMARLYTWIDYNMKYKFNDDWNIKEFKPILLINPVCWEIIKVNRHGVEETVGSGDILNNMYVFTAERFMNHLLFT